MRKTEILIVAAVLAVAGLTFALERLDPSAVRVIAIALCSLLLLLFALGMVARSRAKRAQALAAMREESAPGARHSSEA